MARCCFEIARIHSCQDNNVRSGTSEGMSWRISYPESTIVKIPCESVGRRTTLNSRYVKRDRTPSTWIHGAHDNTRGRIDKICYYNTKTNQYDTASRCLNRRLIVSGQHDKKGTRLRIGMGGKSAVAAAIVEVGSTITKIPVVLRQPQSSIESSRTIR